MTYRNFTRRSFVKGAATLSMLCAAGGVPTLLSACTNEEKYVNTSALRTVVDSVEREVEVPSEITRVVPSGPYAQLILTTLAPDRLIGLSSSFSTRQAQYFPEYLTSLPVLGRYYGKNADMNYENLIAQYPDIIIDAGEEGDSMVESMDGLQNQTGVPAVFVNATLTNMPHAYRWLGDVLNVQDRAEALATYIEDVLSFAEAHRSEIEERNIGVMYATGAYGYQVKRAGSVNSQALELPGFRNVAELTDANSTEVSPEQVMLWQPDVLLLSKEMGFFDQIYEDKTWASIKAVREKQVYEVPYQPYEWLDRPPSVQTVLGLQWVGNLLAPDIYDFDMVEKAREFYELFWSYELTEENITELLGNSTLL